MMQVVIPMAGLGTRFTDYGFNTNKYLLPINIELQSMIELAILSLNISIPCKYYFIINEEHGFNDNLRNILSNICKKYNYNYHIESVLKLTEGPASTVNIIKNFIEMDKPMIVSNSDQVLYNWDFLRFVNISEKYDGCVLTYKPEYELTIGSIDKHSFVHINENGVVDECREKIVLSDKALVGVHYFKTASMFFDAYNYMEKNDIRAPNGEFYLSLCYQSMIELGKSVGYCDLDICKETFYPVGEPDDYFNYLYSVGGYKHSPIYLDDKHILFSNGVSIVEYMRIKKDEKIINDGIIILCSGESCILDNVLTKINKYQITNESIICITDCEVIKIKYIDYKKNDNTKIYDLCNFTRGWLIGNFEPSIIKTKQFEVGILTHKKSEKWDYHYHEHMYEINLLLEGKLLINNREIFPGQLFLIEKNQLVCPNFLENCKFFCIKTPSIIGDKVCL